MVGIEDKAVHFSGILIDPNHQSDLFIVMLDQAS